METSLFGGRSRRLLVDGFRLSDIVYTLFIMTQPLYSCNRLIET